MNIERQYRSKQRAVSFEALVKAWLEARRWAREIEWGMDAEQKWELIKALVAAAPDEDMLGSIGAGPLEDLLYGNAEDFIERVEQEAAKSEKFRFSLSIVRKPNMILRNPDRSEEINRRIAHAIATD